MLLFHAVFSHSWWFSFASGFANETSMATGTPVGLKDPAREASSRPGCSGKLRLIPKWGFIGCVISLFFSPNYCSFRIWVEEEEGKGTKHYWVSTVYKWLCRGRRHLLFIPHSNSKGKSFVLILQIKKLRLRKDKSPKVPQLITHPAGTQSQSWLTPKPVLLLWEFS